MSILRKAVWVVSTGVVTLAMSAISAQGFPVKPIRLVASSPGSGTELATRIIVPALTANFGQSVIVENRPGGIIQGEIVSRAPADGYTLLSAGSSFALGPLLSKTPYDPIRDFSPVSLLGRYPNVVVVHPSVAANSIKELIALAKAKPGALNYASGPTGASNHLAAELFKSMAGVNIVRVTYKGGGPALNDLIAGQVQLLFASTGSAVPHLKSGRLRALAVTSAQPSTLVPGLPTVAASGLSGYVSESIGFMLAPARTPAAVIRRVHQGVVHALNQADVREKLLAIGVEPVTSLPQELAAEMKADVARVGKLIKDTGMTAEP
jgi:tripartite-type tricarboxylate transporter receptor subunit TctC